MVFHRNAFANEASELTVWYRSSCKCGNSSVHPIPLLRFFVLLVGTAVICNWACSKAPVFHKGPGSSVELWECQNCRTLAVSEMARVAQRDRVEILLYKESLEARTLGNSCACVSVVRVVEKLNFEAKSRPLQFHGTIAICKIKTRISELARFV